MEKKEVFCRIFIVGENVFGVGYRPFLLRMARRLTIPRFEAENIEGATQKIEVLAGGNQESISDFIKTINADRPRNALVSSITVDPNCPQHVLPIDEYDRILSAEQQDKIVSTGLQMLGKQDQMLGKQDQMLGKQDQMLGKQEETIQSIKQVDNRVSQTNESIKCMDNNMTARFDRMDVKYDKMSDRMERIDKTLERLADALVKIAESKN